MKKTVKVTIEKEYDIEIDDKLLTNEHINEFEQYMFELDGTFNDGKLDDLFNYAAKQLAQGEEHFIEGLGHIASVRTVKFKQDEGKDVAVVWDGVEEWIDTEIVE